MGMQSVGVRRLGIAGVTSTYVTGTWTSFIIGLVTLRRSYCLRYNEGEARYIYPACHLDYVSPRCRYRGGLMGIHFLLKAPDYFGEYYRFRAYRRTYPISLDRLYRGFQSQLLVLKNLRNHVSENLKKVYQ